MGVLSSLVATLPDLVFALEIETLKIVDVNRAAFGFLRDELLAMDAFALFPRWWDAEKTLKPGAAIATFVKHKDGSEEPVDVRLCRATHERRELLLASVRVERTMSEVERELADVNTYLHAIVENIPDMIFVKDAETLSFRRFNRAGEELLGFTRGELLGKTDSDFYPPEQAAFFLKKDRETLGERMTVDIASEPIQTKFRGERILHTRKIPIYDERGKPLYLLGISEDITERIKAEQSLREFADVVRYLRDAVVSFRLDGTIASWNPAAERLYGFTSDRALEMPFESLVPEADLVAFREHRAAVLRGDAVELREVRRMRPDGREVEVEESLFAIMDAQGAPQRIASIARDVTELLRWQRATRVLEEGAAALPAKAEGGLSGVMTEVLESVELVARDRNATVLVLGETGAGKSWIARRIHQSSPRADKPFFEINCAGLASQLVESELFGHERGAFTGATGLKRGLVETAEGGTLFLDEVGELSLTAQAQLLTFIDTKAYRRVGGNRALSADVRLIAATNVELERAVDEGRFRRDLFYRLRVVPICMPALRERTDEICGLAEDILADFARRSGKRAVLRDAALAAMKSYHWPGNIRELRNALERALILGGGSDIDVKHLPPEIAQARARSLAPLSSSPNTRNLDAVERETITRALDECGGNRTRAAERLGISRSTLKRKLSALRIDK